MVCLLSVCVSQENYKKVVCDLLPKLQTLDGEALSFTDNTRTFIVGL